MTDSDLKCDRDVLDALIRERAGYERRGAKGKERVTQVDEAIERHAGHPAAKAIKMRADELTPVVEDDAGDGDVETTNGAPDKPSK